jgi:hypothetical protein
VGDDGHWVKWHTKYDVEDSSLARRLHAVQRRLRETLDSAPPGPIRLISMCAGQGRDVLGVLQNHDRRTDLSARLVEVDPVLVADARGAAHRAGLHVEVVQGDASNTTAYAGAVPADIILVCGVFGNIPQKDVHQTVLELPHLSARDATVIWTRHRRPPDHTPAIRAWFADAGYREVAFDTEDGRWFGVGTNRLDVEPAQFRNDRPMFHFRGKGVDAHF